MHGILTHPAHPHPWPLLDAPVQTREAPDPAVEKPALQVQEDAPDELVLPDGHAEQVVPVAL